VCKGTRERVCVCVHVRVRELMCVSVCASLCAHVCVHVVRLRIPVNLIRLPTTECQCTIQWGQNKVCEFCMAASPCSCAPLPLAQPGPLLPVGGQGLAGGCRRSGVWHPLCSSL